MSRRLVVVSAGLSSPSSTRLLADRIGQAVQSLVGARGEALEVTHVELRELALPLAQAMASGGVPNPQLDQIRETISAADGLVAVTPVFRASYSGLFKMFFDVLDDAALIDMPVLIAATAGTPRHSLVLDHALRPLFAYARAVVLPTGVFAATEDFGAGESSGLNRRIARAAGEMAAAIVADAAGVEGFLPTDDEPARPDAEAETGSRAGRRSTGVGVGPAMDFADLLRGHDGT